VWLGHSIAAQKPIKSARGRRTPKLFQPGDEQNEAGAKGWVVKGGRTASRIARSQSSNTIIRTRNAPTTPPVRLVKERDVIDICSSANVITDGVYKILIEKLGKRNSAAHPSTIHVNQIHAEAFVDELIRNVILGLVI
jgi:hypothetical protein